MSDEEKPHALGGSSVGKTSNTSTGSFAIPYDSKHPVLPNGEVITGKNTLQSFDEESSSTEILHRDNLNRNFPDGSMLKLRGAFPNVDWCPINERVPLFLLIL